jgi:hypothetical protein
MCAVRQVTEADLAPGERYRVDDELLLWQVKPL